MRLRWFIPFLFIAIAAVAYGRPAGTSITVTPDEMKSGETKTFTDDGTRITVRRDADDIRVEIEGAGKTRRLIITKTGGTISIGRGADWGDGIIIGPDHFERFNTVPRVMPKFGKTQNWFVCPKDHATLRVPEAREGDTFRCPVDGTTMEKRKGHGFSFFFDDDFLRSEDL